VDIDNLDLNDLLDRVQNFELLEGTDGLSLNKKSDKNSTKRDNKQKHKREESDDTSAANMTNACEFCDEVGHNVPKCPAMQRAKRM
jgi:hypothetical protein